MVLVFKNCCCCIDLRTGSLIIGYFNLIGLLTLFLRLIVNFTYFLHSWVSITIVVLDLILIIIHLIFTITLLYGIHKNIHKFIPRYVFYYSILLVLNVIFFVVDWIMLSYTSTEVISEIISFLLTLYFLLVIRSYYYTATMADATNSQPTAVYTQQMPNNPHAPQSVYLAPGTVTSSGLFVMPRGYPGAQGTQVAYPIQGGYPVQGVYPVQSAYPVQDAHPNLSHYSMSGDQQAPGQYLGPPSGLTRSVPSAPMDTEKTGFY